MAQINETRCIGQWIPARHAVSTSSLVRLNEVRKLLNAAVEESQATASTDSGKFQLLRIAHECAELCPIRHIPPNTAINAPNCRANPIEHARLLRPRRGPVLQ